eukprot:SAG31_NODE_1275_length_9050_cov_1.986929_1_plen_559_part_00
MTEISAVGGLRILCTWACDAQPGPLCEVLDSCRKLCRPLASHVRELVDAAAARLYADIWAPAADESVPTISSLDSLLRLQLLRNVGRGSAVVIQAMDAAALVGSLLFADGSLSHGSRLPATMTNTSSVVQLSIGERHCLLTTKDGAMFSCGDGRHGVLGYKASSSPQFRQVERFCTLDVAAQQDIDIRPVEIADQVVTSTGVFVAKVAAGGRHSVCLDSNGTAYTWGLGRGGRLGLPGQQTVRFWPTALDNSKAFAGAPLVDIAAAGGHTIFVDSSGVAFGCGCTAEGRLGLGQRHLQRHAATPQIVLLPAETRITSCAAGGHSGFVPPAQLQATELMNRQESTTKQAIPPLQTGGHSIFLASDGSVFVTGSVGSARLGTRNRVPGRLGYSAFSRTCYSWASPWKSVNQLVPVALASAVLKRGNVVAVAAGHCSTLMLTKSGDVFSYGMTLRGPKKLRQHISLGSKKYGQPAVCGVGCEPPPCSDGRGWWGVPPGVFEAQASPDTPHCERNPDLCGKSLAIFAAAGQIACVTADGRVFWKHEQVTSGDSQDWRPVTIC